MLFQVTQKTFNLKKGINVYDIGMVMCTDVIDEDLLCVQINVVENDNFFIYYKLTFLFEIIIQI
jgi:hypothetical protein